MMEAQRKMQEKIALTCPTTRNKAMRILLSPNSIAVSLCSKKKKNQNPTLAFFSKFMWTHLSLKKNVLFLVGLLIWEPLSLSRVSATQSPHSKIGPGLPYSQWQDFYSSLHVTMGPSEALEDSNTGITFWYSSPWKVSSKARITSLTFLLMM